MLFIAARHAKSFEGDEFAIAFTDDKIVFMSKSQANQGSFMNQILAATSRASHDFLRTLLFWVFLGWRNL